MIAVWFYPVDELCYVTSVFLLEKRAKFDSGEDPLDPEQQAGPGGGPFWHQGFNPFGQGGFQFKFHFN